MAPKAPVRRSITAGIEGNIRRKVLPGNIITVNSGIGVYSPACEETPRIGIVAVIEVHPVIACVRDGRDDLMEKALSLMN